MLKPLSFLFANIVQQVSDYQCVLEKVEKEVLGLEVPSVLKNSVMKKNCISSIMFQTAVENDESAETESDSKTIGSETK